MGKICIILNTRDEKQIAARLQNLYQNGDEYYMVRLAEGFTKQITDDTTEILFGGGVSLRLKDHEALRDEAFTFITESKLPIIGICFGAQLIARAFGSRIVKLPTCRDGVCLIRIIAQKADFDNRYIAHVYKNQTWSLQELPECFKIMAVSSEGVEIFIHRDKPVAGLQFHPEQFTNAADGIFLFLKVRSLINAK